MFGDGMRRLWLHMSHAICLHACLDITLAGCAASRLKVFSPVKDHEQARTAKMLALLGQGAMASCGASEERLRRGDVGVQGAL